MVGKTGGRRAKRGAWGGKRHGAGRKPRGGRASPPHATRPRHTEQHPLHVTLRALNGVPSLRKKRVFRAVKHAFFRANTEGKHREHFRVTHFSVQGNHVHLVAEATTELRLSRGMQGLAVRIARAVNKASERHGRVFASRYHARALCTPRDVRNVLAYVLLNDRRHLYQSRKLLLGPWYFDPCSSAAEFDGWQTIRGLDPPPLPRQEATVPAATPLLTWQWRLHGLIRPDEVPGAGPELRAA